MRVVTPQPRPRKTAVFKRWLGLATLLCAGWLGHRTAHAQLAQGFQLNAYEPTPAGEWSFGVPHPWYSRSFETPRYFSGGITLNYNHNPLVFVRRDPVTGDLIRDPGDVVVQHQLMGHADLAFSFLDRVNISASLPITLLERGNDLSDVAGVKPVAGLAVGDPRVGLMVRLLGQPYRNPISLSLGGYVWVPINKYTNAFPAQVGETEWRGMPMVVLSGLAKRIMWSLTAGVYFRPEAQIGNLPEGMADKMGSQLHLGAAIAYADLKKRFSIGAEAWANTAFRGANAFSVQGTGLEVMPLAAYYNIGGYVNVGVAAGLAVLDQPGTPDARALLRIAYAPMKTAEAPKPPRTDRDRDGVYDRDDMCPDEPIRSNQTPNAPEGDPDKLGCPLRDRDTDGVYDRDDLCIDEPIRSPLHPDARAEDPKRRGCPERPVLKVTSTEGKAVVFEKIYFEKNSANLMIDEDRAVKQAKNQKQKTEAKAKVAATRQVLSAAKDILAGPTAPAHVGILAYADRDVPSGQDRAAYNLDLTQRRAQAVQDYLTAQGVDAARLTAVGCGYFDDNDYSPEHMEQQRRVEFYVGKDAPVTVTSCLEGSIRP